MINDQILRKIKRCMDLSSSNNEHEAVMSIKQMKKFLLLGLTVFLVGCGMTDSEYQEAKYQISESLASDFFRKNYGFSEISYEKDGEEIKIFLLNDSLIHISQEICSPMLGIKKNNIEEEKILMGVGRRYSLIDSSEVDLNTFFNCVKDSVNSTDLDADDLYKMVNDPKYMKYKEVPEIKLLTNKIKSDNRITIGEALSIYSSINNEIKKTNKKKHESLIRDL